MARLSPLLLLLLSGSLASCLSLVVFVPLPCASGNCTTAIAAAIDSCAAAGVPCTVALTAGTYLLTGATLAPRINIHGVNNLSIVGAGTAPGDTATTLLIDDVAGAVYLLGSTNILFANFAVDMVRLPYSYGEVVSLNATAATVRFDCAAYPLDEAATARYPWLLSAQAVTSFDPINRRIPPGGTDSYALPPAQLPLAFGGANGDGSCNFTVGSDARPARLRFVGDWVVARHVVYEAVGFETHTTRGLTWENVTLLAMAGMGVTGSSDSDIAVRGLHIVRQGDRPVSINADGVHFINPRGGTLEVSGCVLEGQGDDGLNIETRFLDIEAMPDARTLRLGRSGAVYPAGLLPLQAGDTIAFVSRHTMAELGRVAVAAVSARNGSVTLAADAPAAAALFDLVYSLNATADAVLVTGNLFTQNRARGSLLTVARNLVATGNVYNWTSGPAVEVVPDGCTWFQGVPVSNWSFIDNTVVMGNYGGDAQAASVFISTSLPLAWNGSRPLDGQCGAPAAGAPPQHSGVLFARNRITTSAAPVAGSPGGRAAFAITGTSGLVVANNTVTYAAVTAGAALRGQPEGLPAVDFSGAAVEGAVVRGNVCDRSGGCVVQGF